MPSCAEAQVYNFTSDSLIQVCLNPSNNKRILFNVFLLFIIVVVESERRPICLLGICTM